MAELTAHTASIFVVTHGQIESRTEIRFVFLTFVFIEILGKNKCEKGSKVQFYNNNYGLSCR